MTRERLRAVALDAWPLLLALVLTAPLVTGYGYPLARDLVFVPRQPFTDASVGLGSSAPRAVPLDAVVAALTHVVDGGVLARLVLPLALAAAGWGMHRMVGGLGLAARLTASGLAVWNPFTVERLMLGQWALLLGYAALPWLVVLGTAWRREGRTGSLAAALVWVAVASLTPTGGLLAVATVLVAGARRTQMMIALVAGCLVLQLPWVLPSLVGTAAVTSDPDGVAAFAASPEGPGGVLTALLGLGGIWDARSVPATRDSWWAPATAAVVVLALVLGRRVLARALGDAAPRIAGLGAAGLLLAAAPTVGPGRAAFEWLVETVPGAGLLRDSQKFVALFAVLAVAALAALAQRVVRGLADLEPGWGRELARSVAGLAILLPVLLVPDGGPGGAWETLEPVRFPSGFDAVAVELEGRPGDLAVLPWRSYRRFSWGNGETSSDPAVRWFDCDVVVADDLQVGPDIVGGEDPRAARIGAAIREEPAAIALAGAGVAWALVYLDDPDAGNLDLTGLDEVYRDDDIALFRVQDPASPPAGPGAAARVAVVGVDVLALAVALLALGLGSAAAWRGRRKPPGASVR